jgi:hypothetical protein
MVLAFKHLDFSCHLDFDIWNLANGIATPRQVGARNDTGGYYTTLQTYKVSPVYLNQISGLGEQLQHTR